MYHFHINNNSKKQIINDFHSYIINQILFTYYNENFMEFYSYLENIPIFSSLILRYELKNIDFHVNDIFNDFNLCLNCSLNYQKTISVFIPLKVK